MHSVDSPAFRPWPDYDHSVLKRWCLLPFSWKLKWQMWYSLLCGRYNLLLLESVVSILQWWSWWENSVGGPCCDDITSVPVNYLMFPGGAFVSWHFCLFPITWCTGGCLHCGPAITVLSWLRWGSAFTCSVVRYYDGCYRWFGDHIGDVVRFPYIVDR